MNSIGRNIRKIKRQLGYSKFLDAFLNGILASLVITGLLLFFGLKPWYSLVIGLAVLAYSFVRSLKQASLAEIEKKVPDLQWQLRTAADNMHNQNELVDQLHKEVSDKIGYVSVMDLLSGKHSLFRLGGIFIVAILLVTIQQTEFTVGKAVDVVKGGVDRLPDANSITGQFVDRESTEDVQYGALDDILGEESDVEIGKRKLDVTLNAERNQADAINEEDLQARNHEGVTFRGRASGEQDRSYTETIDEEDEEIVRAFYNNLNK